MTKAIYPGSFDPATYGHLNVIRRAACIFDSVTVAIGDNPEKAPLLSVEERVALLEECCADMPNVEVESFSGLLVDFVKSKSAEVIIKGLRAVSDFEVELQIALTNRSLAPDVETVFMMTDTEFSFLSSSVVKQVASLGGSVSHMVPPPVEKALLAHPKMAKYSSTAKEEKHR